jgi:AcrR family transcriptional regulator
MSAAAVPPAGDHRARAARTKRDRTRRALLDAADSAFGSRGWARTRVEDIAQSAGVSAATAYNHFPTKHALLAQVYAPIISPLLVQARHDIATGRPVVEALSDQVRPLCRLCARNRKLTSAFFAAASEYAIKVGALPDPDDDADPRALVPMPDALELLIAHGQSTGELRSYPCAADLADLLVTTVLVRNVNRPNERPETTVQLLLTVMFSALRPEVLVVAERPLTPGALSRSAVPSRPLSGRRIAER